MAIRTLPNNSYIYVLVDPRTDIVRYVGKSFRPKERLKDHLNFNKPRNHKEKWLQQLKNLGLAPNLVIIETVDINDSSAREQFWIADYRAKGFKLTNATDGGDGTVGYVFTEEQRKVVSERLIGNTRAAGHIVTKETRETISETLKALNLVNPFQGKRHTPESLAKMSKSHKLNPVSKCPEGCTCRHHSVETRAKIAAVQIGKIHSEETKKKMSEGNKRASALKTPEERSMLFGYKSWESRRAKAMLL